MITDKVTKERLMFGNWEYDDSKDALIQYEAILDLFTNSPLYEEDRYLTVDVARHGRDKIVLTFWKGWEAYRIIEKEKQGIDITQEDIRNYAEDERVPYSRILVDEDGLGGGVKDNLRGIKGFVANSSPYKKENFRSLKDQCAWYLADKVNRREIAVTANLSEEQKQKIVGDLEQLRDRDIHNDGKKQLVPKDEVKECLVLNQRIL